MFNHSLQQPSDSNNQSASINLFTGLNLIGKVLLTPHEWNTEFAKIQSSHLPKDLESQYGSNAKNQLNQQTFSSQLDQTFRALSTKQCQLCKAQHLAQDFHLMCKCQHKFCYSCLNVYAISKVNGQERVKCPEPSCSSQMRLSSQVYKTLPEVVKLKYLQWKNQNKARQIDLSESCTRCLQKRHSGQCKVAFSRQNIESAFQYRKCYKCQTEARISAGVRQVQCQSCNSVFCYLCGETWPIEGEHSCAHEQNIFVLQEEVKQSAAIVQANSYYCEDSQCICIKNTGKCFSNVFYCKRCELGICLGNSLLLPVRVIASAIVSCCYVLMLIPITILIAGWITAAVVTGVTCYSCEWIAEMNGGMQVVAILGYPIFMLGGIAVALRNLFKPFLQAMAAILDFYQTAMCEMWVQFGPKECCT